MLRCGGRSRRKQAGRPVVVVLERCDFVACVYAGRWMDGWVVEWVGGLSWRTALRCQKRVSVSERGFMSCFGMFPFLATYGDVKGPSFVFRGMGVMYVFACAFAGACACVCLCIVRSLATLGLREVLIRRVSIQFCLVVRLRCTPAHKKPTASAL